MTSVDAVPVEVLGFIGLFGAIIGSFLNVVGLRMLADESILWPGSHCTHCQTPIHWFDNVPILGYLLLGGRCRACKQCIHWQYPVIELLSAAGAIFITQHWGLGWPTACLWLLWANTLLIAITDFRTQHVFLLNTGFMLLGGLLFQWLSGGDVLNALLAAGVAFFGFELLIFCTKLLFGTEGFGHGDSWILSGLAAYVGWPTVSWIIPLAFALQLLPALVLLCKQWWQQKHYGDMASVLGAFATMGLALAWPSLVADSQWYWVPMALCGVSLVCLFFFLRTIDRKKKQLQALEALPEEELAIAVQNYGYSAMPFGPALLLAGWLVLWGLLGFFNFT